MLQRRIGFAVHNGRMRSRPGVSVQRRQHAVVKSRIRCDGQPPPTARFRWRCGPATWVWRRFRIRRRCRIWRRCRIRRRTTAVAVVRLRRTAAARSRGLPDERLQRTGPVRLRLHNARSHRTFFDAQKTWVWQYVRPTPHFERMSNLTARILINKIDFSSK